MMADMSKCKHGGYQGYCDECSPGWELKLIEANAQDMIFERGVQVGKREAAEAIESLRAEVARLKEELKLEEQRIADLMGDINRIGHDKDTLTQQLSAAKAKIDELQGGK